MLRSCKKSPDCYYEKFIEHWREAANMIFQMKKCHCGQKKNRAIARPPFIKLGNLTFARIYISLLTLKES